MELIHNTRENNYELEKPSNQIQIVAKSSRKGIGYISKYGVNVGKWKLVPGNKTSPSFG